MNFFDRVVLDAVRQIPEGFVTTYGEIARALGDVRAARAVGETLKKGVPGIPCHRVVMSNGSLGGYAFGGPDRKKELLIEEGIEFNKGKVNLNKHLITHTDLKVYPLLEKMKKTQKKIYEMRIEERVNPDIVAGVDIAYRGNKAFVGIAIADEEGIKEKFTATGNVYFPYIPTYLAFRELPPCYKLIKNTSYDLLFVDGHGTAHPRKAGEAVHFGVAVDVPSIGAAKSRLWSGSVEYRGCYISPGNYVSENDAADIAKRFWGEKQPLVLEVAHKIASQVKMNE